MKHHLMYFIDGYACRSPLRSISPAFKTVTAVLLLLLCLWENNGLVSVFVMISMACLNLKLNRIRAGDYLRLMTVPAVFIILSCAAIAVDAGHGEQGFFITATRESLMESFNVMLRAFASVSILYGLALSTTISQITLALISFHVPKAVTELMHLIYRYIFILMDTQARLTYAAQSRLGYMDFKTACRTFGSSMGSLLVISMRRSGAYFDAMEARCYDGELVFLEEEKILGPKHILCVFFYGVCMVGIGRLAGSGGWL